MKHSAIYLFVWLLGAALWGCHVRSEAWRQLDAAEEMIEDAPDSALAILDGVDASRLKGEEERARYSLLKSMALHKNFIDVDSDSLTSVALAYYGGRSNRYDMLANFQHAWVMYNSGRYSDAVPMAMDALSISEDISDTLYMARCNSLLGNLFFESYNPEFGLSYSIRAQQLYQRIGRDTNRLYCMFDQAWNEYNSSRQEKGLKTMLRLREELLSTDNTNLLAMCDAALTIFYNEMGNWRESIKSFNRLENLQQNITTTNELSAAAISYVALGQIDSSRILLDKCRLLSDQNTETCLKRAEVWYYKAIGDYQSAQTLTESLIDYQNKQIHEVLKQSTIEGYNKYLKSKYEQTEQKSKRNKYYTYIAIVSFLLVLGCAIGFMRYKSRQHKARIEQYMAEIALTTAAEKETYGFANEVLGKYLCTINNLCDTFFYGDNSEAFRKQTYKDIKNVVEDMKGKLDILVDYVNKRENGVIDKIRQTIPSLTDTDLKYIALILANFSQRATCMLMDMKPSTFYAKRLNIAEKLEKTQNKFCVEIAHRLKRRPKAK